MKSDEEEGPPKYLIEYSKSSRAGCRKCKEKIGSKVLRFGSGTVAQHGHFAYYWNHLDCVSDNVLKKVPHQTLAGLSDLSPEDQEIVRTRYLRIDAPKIIPVSANVDVDDLAKPKKQRKKKADSDNDEDFITQKTKRRKKSAT